MDKQQLIDKLNEDLAGEFSAIIQYITYAAKATGPYLLQLAQFFLTEAAMSSCTPNFWPTRLSPWAANQPPGTASARCPQQP